MVGTGDTGSSWGNGGSGRERGEGILRYGDIGGDGKEPKAWDMK